MTGFQIAILAVVISPMYYIAWWFLYRCGKEKNT